jgi:hypothetical protein
MKLEVNFKANVLSVVAVYVLFAVTFYEEFVRTGTKLEFRNH